MNKILRNIMITVLAIVCACSFFACADSADGGKQEKGLLYKKIDGVYTIYDYVDEGDNKTVLDIGALLETDVTNVRIKASAFAGNDTLKEIIVPATVTKIDKGAFAGMKALEKLTIPFVGMTADADVAVGDTAPATNKSVDSERTIAHLFGESEYDEGVVQTISYGTDADKNVTCYIPLTLNTITVKPASDYNIPMYAFGGLSTRINVVLENGVKEIGQYAFTNAIQLFSLSLPTTVTKIHDGAFSGAKNLNTINLKDLTSLTEIGDSAFAGTALTSVELPASLQKIGNNAFKSSKLTEATLNAGLQSIGHYSFYGCESLTKVYTNGALTIGNYAFGNCKKLTYFGSKAKEAEDTIEIIGCVIGANAFDTGKTYTEI